MRPRIPLSRAASAVLLAAALAACGGARATGAPTAKSSGAAAGDGTVDVAIQLRTDTFTLPNGLQVVLHPEVGAPSTYVLVEYGVGSKDDPRGRSGLAHLFEHLQFEPLKHGGGPEKDVAAWLDESSARYNASTSLDWTRYHETVPARELARALWLEAERMAYPVASITQQTLDRERDVVLNEWREHYENEEYGHVWAAAYRELFGDDHPYARPTIGVPEELRAVTLADVHAFAKAHYRPNHATLVVCGAFDRREARAVVEKYFATIPPGAPSIARSYDAPVLAKSRKVVVAADVKAPMVAVAWPAPAIHAEGFEALALGLHIFRGGASYRLVTDAKVATSVSASVRPGKLGSVAIVQVMLRPGASPSDAVSTIDEYLSRTSRYGDTILFDRFGDLKSSFMVGKIREMERLDARAEELLHGLSYHGQPDAVQEDLRRWQSVRLAHVGSAVDQLLADANRLTVIVEPTKGAPRAGKVVR